MLKKEHEKSDSDKTQMYIDSIKTLQVSIDESKYRQSLLERSYDSLLSIEPQIIYRTREKVKFIFNTNDPDVLDSIIRSGWKTRPRYN